MMLPRNAGKERRSAKGSARRGAGKGAAGPKTKPTLMPFVTKRDYSGALTLLEFEKGGPDAPPNVDEWIGYCAFHAGDYNKALDAYGAALSDASDAEQLGEGKAAGKGELGAEDKLRLCRALCFFYLQDYAEAAAEAGKVASADHPAVVRLRFQCAHRLNREEELLDYHGRLSESREDQLCLASVHVLRNHFQQAADIYKSMLLSDREALALNVYIAICYYKLDYYDVSLEILDAYLKAFPDSPVAANVKACNHYRLYNGQSAESKLRELSDRGVSIADHPLLRHNLVVFRGGTGALQVLPGLVDVLPEARLNLVIFYLRTGEYDEALAVMEDVEPSTPHEYILKAVVHALVGQRDKDSGKLRAAQDMFQVVGASASECDTIPGRQCMASCFFLLRQFDEVNVYLQSIKTYLYNDDAFNWNYAISLAKQGSYDEALECLLQVQNEEWRRSYTYLSWLARCHVMTGNGKLAWDLYMRGEVAADKARSLLLLIANDCYRMGSFYLSAQAFDVLNRMSKEDTFERGRMGAIVGVFQQVVARHLGALEPGVPAPTPEELAECVQLLRGSDNPQSTYIASTIRSWCASNGVPLPEAE